VTSQLDADIFDFLTNQIFDFGSLLVADFLSCGRARVPGTGTSDEQSHGEMMRCVKRSDDAVDEDAEPPLAGYREVQSSICAIVDGTALSMTTGHP
jgi:hypothetical protein